MLLFPSRPNQLSEWVYTNFNDLKSIFLKVQEQCGGMLSEFSLDEIDKQYDTVMKYKKKYIGEINFEVQTTISRPQDSKMN